MKHESDTSATINGSPKEQLEGKPHGKQLQLDARAYYQQVALNMRKARRKLNLTQQQVADAMQIPRSTYKSLESGNTGIYCYHMAKWAHVTGYDVRALTRGTEYDLSSHFGVNELIEIMEELPKPQFDALVALVKTF